MRCLSPGLQNWSRPNLTGLRSWVSRTGMMVPAHHRSAFQTQDARSRASTLPHTTVPCGGPAPDPSLDAPLQVRLLPVLGHDEHRCRTACGCSGSHICGCSLRLPHVASIVGARAAVDITTMQDRGAREPTRQGEVLLRWVSTAASCGASITHRAAHAQLVQQLSTQDAPAGERCGGGGTEGPARA